MISPEQQELYDLVQQQSNIVTVISAYLPLQTSRRGMKGNCPFHADQSNSLMVSPDKNIYKCFGCGDEGGPVEFVSRTSGVPLETALIFLARQLAERQSA
ncbi:CHC2 zinc finger domain-containing protein [Mucilaginibacter terrae]|uniref:DNA primase n=1 Tax=Mucilaginibacter terrae TaxID=1955052 RepID=A0ABU3GN64_9SPHI|nr:CHC2 zinc finger domain-containing protein [Mucilaginibacter terrae]MDT3401213.1 DNA primase [Mucilaginibacter terrae]